MKILRSNQKIGRQRGVALFVTIVFVMFSMLLALWASRTSLFNEMIVGNDADYQRAFEAAQALLQDAELDIRNESPDGLSACSAANCREQVASAFKMPHDQQGADGVTTLLQDLDAKAAKCHSGLCTKRQGRQDFWNSNGSADPNLGEVEFAQMAQPGVGARYGDYSGASVSMNPSNPNAPVLANPILADRSAPDQGGWYWIEIMPYVKNSKNSNLIQGSSGNSDLLPLALTPNVVYRITALAYGRKPGTVAILQQTYVRKVLDD